MARESARPSFETLFERLESQVQKLEQGGLSLEESIAVFEEGMKLARECQSRLDETELRIVRLKESFDDGADARDPSGQPAPRS